MNISGNKTTGSDFWIIGLSSILIAIFAVFPYLPGRVNYDVLDIYKESQIGLFRDWHVPFMSWLWSKIGPSPELIAALTTLVAVIIVGCGSFMFHRAGFKRHHTIILTFVFAMIPPVYSNLGASSKDTWVAALIMLMMVLSIVTQRRGLFILRALLLCLAITIRPEMVLLVPVFAVMEYVLFQRRLLQAGAFAVLCALLLIAHNVFIYRVLDTQRTNPESVIFLFDLAGISVRTDKMLLPPRAFPPQDMEILKKHYNKYDIVPFIWHLPEDEMVQTVRGEALREVQKRWLQAILAHPLAYLSTRKDVALEHFIGSAMIHPETPDMIGLYFPKLYHSTINYILLSRDVFGSHFLPFIGSLIVLWFLWRRRRDRDQPVFIAYISLAIIYELIWLPLLASPNYRYGYLSVVLFNLILILTLFRYRDYFLGLFARIFGYRRQKPLSPRAGGK
ncbi:MAG: hypothetical protein C0605_11085 [Hyphomicrobiales bacterium]|nr:MAG: hypothetical protein C0605_11085 [Hyphomicrobiales bacterium]